MATIRDAARAKPMDERRPAAERVQRPHAKTTERREAVLKAAMNVFGARGYNKGALVEVAEQAGMTHAGVLHHFGSKEGLLVAMLKYRDGEEVAGVPARAQAEGPAFLAHLVDTVDENTRRRGVVQAYSVLSGESVTDGHPAHEYFQTRLDVLRVKIAGVLGEVSGNTDEQELLDSASALIAVMDGLQVQWLLNPDAVDMPRIVSRTLDEIVARLRAQAGA
ncbi:TetR/AcrR family transcriptional regulator [Agromyces subbeticus]|uniref:TetR/AcrR family transcriptional regulator n=1 Tax=Agromyces subbeticus TaxID=293890 RepID=UPI00146AC809|nr:TetR/AcrR family transcriptional regulator [Agromyces subbeticus]